MLSFNGRQKGIFMRNINCLIKKERMAVIEFEELLLKRFPKRLRQLILFGSKARGTSTRSSDLDLLVVVSKDGKRLRQEIATLTHEPIVHFGVLLSPIVIEERELNVWSPLMEHVKKEGVILWTNKNKKNM
jgi:predicted nucleotidyltransferase